MSYPPQQQQPGYVQQQQPAGYVVTQPVAQVPHTNFQTGTEREWTSGLFGCFDDLESCACTYFFGECYMCYLTSTRFNEHCCAAWPCCLGPIGSALVFRYKMRHEHNIKGTLMKDCAAAAFCAPCMICQLKREKDVIDGK